MQEKAEHLQNTAAKAWEDAGVSHKRLQKLEFLVKRFKQQARYKRYWIFQLAMLCWLWCFAGQSPRTEVPVC